MSGGAFPLPAGLPRPVDDGTCAHLPGMRLPPIALPSTAGAAVRLDALGPARTVLYAYPMTGVPGRPLPEGWDMIPGARGCTPQACAFRDHHAELARVGAEVLGLSTQTTAYQREMAARLHLPFAILSDAALELCTALRLPTFTVDDLDAVDPEGAPQPTRLVKRLTLIIRAGTIEAALYPVFPPDQGAEQALAWLARHPL